MGDFTTNDEFDALVDGDTMVQFKGTVAWVDGVKSLKNGKRLFRFVMTNQTGRKIRILVWEKLIPIYESRVAANMTISFARLKCGSVNPEYVHEAENVARQELTVTPQTKVEWCTPARRHVIRSVSIVDAYDEFGIISIQGYVRDTFDEISYGTSTFSSGTITDGEHRIKVQIRSYSKPAAERLPAGTHVEVKGQVNRDKLHVMPYIQCNAFTDLRIVSDEIMDATQLRAGHKIPDFRSPKKQRTDAQDLPPTAPEVKSNDTEMNDSV